MSELYKINQIANLFGISCDTLKLYEKMGFFSPAHVDENTKYRYYGISEVFKLDYILQLKRLDFTLTEIKQVLENKLSIEEKHKALIEEQKRIKKLISLFENYPSPADNKIKIITYPKHYVVCEDIIVEKIEDLVNTFVKLTSFLVENKLTFKSYSSPYAIFNGQFSLNNFCCRACLEVFPSSSPLVKEIPAKSCLTLTHKGSYDTLVDTYKCLTDYAAENNILLEDCSYERYLLTYGNIPLSSSFITEISFPIKK